MRGASPATMTDGGSANAAAATSGGRANDMAGGSCDSPRMLTAIGGGAWERARSGSTPCPVVPPVLLVPECVPPCVFTGGGVIAGSTAMPWFTPVVSRRAFDPTPVSPGPVPAPAPVPPPVCDDAPVAPCVPAPDVLPPPPAPVV